jgi:hypothetical protein
MRVELLKLLEEKPIIYPTRMESLRVTPGSIHMTLTGHKWWNPESTEKDGRITFVFEGLSEGKVDVTFFNAVNFGWDEALEDFRIQSLAGIDWAQPATHSIYCSTALKDPLSVYIGLQDYLAEAGSYLRAEHFLNCGNKLRKFTELTTSQSYMLARCPSAISEILCSELDRQAVRYNVIAINLPPEDRLWVAMGDADFLCETAVAEFS